MPDRTVDLLFRFLHQKGGRLSKRARAGILSFDGCRSHIHRGVLSCLFRGGHRGANLRIVLAVVSPFFVAGTDDSVAGYPALRFPRSFLDLTELAITPDANPGILTVPSWGDVATVFSSVLIVTTESFTFLNKSRSCCASAPTG